MKPEIKPDRIIFLDFDGVLNQGHGKLHPRLVKQVAALAEQTDAKIVLSTAWRIEPWPWLLRELDRSGLHDTNRVIGKTPMLPYTMTRGREIELWLQRHDKPTRFVVFDDNDAGMFRMDQVRPWFVQTDGFGISKADIERGRKLLTQGRIWTPANVGKVA